MRVGGVCLVVSILVVAGCSAPAVTPTIAPQSSSETSPPVVIDAYPTARNTSEDVAEARIVAEQAVEGDVTPELLTHDDSVREEIPMDWWDAHDQEPFRVVEFRAQSPQDLADYGDKWSVRYVIVQEHQDGSWELLFTSEGY